MIAPVLTTAHASAPAELFDAAIRCYGRLTPQRSLPWRAAARTRFFDALPREVAYPLALLPNGDVWVGGGGVIGDAVYTPSTAQWTDIAPPPCTTSKQSCENPSALLNTVKVLVAGGATFVNAQPYPIEGTNGLADLFDPSTLTWISTGRMNQFLRSRFHRALNLLCGSSVQTAFIA